MLLASASRHPWGPQKRGPKALRDEELVDEIRQILAAPVFAGEGYRKIWARLRHKGVRTCKDRVLAAAKQSVAFACAPAGSGPNQSARGDDRYRYAQSDVGH
jgi:hypothetical protein